MSQTFQVKGSKVVLGERVSGPPSKMYPLLRDIAEKDANTKAIVAEIDTPHKRYLAEIEGVAHGGTANGGLIVHERPTGRRIGATQRTTRSLDSILAVRVVRIVVIKDGKEFKFEAPDYATVAS